MKIISWNINGIRAWKEKDGVLNFIERLETPDIFCMQETKAQEGQIRILTESDNLLENNKKIFKDYPFQYWNCAEKKGYSGVGVISKIEPIRVWYGMDNSPIKNEGRIINAEFKKFILINVYTPNSKSELERLPLRYNEWDISFLRHLKKLNKKKNIVVCGDFNVAHEEIDLARPNGNKTTKTNLGSAGFTDQERERFSNFLEAKFIDSFRKLNPNKIQYSWWSYRAAARERNVGWRIDYFLTSEMLRNKIIEAKIYDKITGSDHCPIGIKLNL